MSPTFTSFTERNYRIYYAGSFVSNVGTWMGRVAQDWLVLTELTDNSSQALGIVTGLQFLPFLVLAPWAGAIADRFPKRRILLVTQALSSSRVSCSRCSSWPTRRRSGWSTRSRSRRRHHRDRQPARQSFVSEMVPRDKLANAVALNSASFNGGGSSAPESRA